MGFRHPDPAGPDAQERLALARQVLALKAQSLTYRAIAAKLAISVSRAWELAQMGLEQDRQILAEKAADVRCIEASKLDRMEEALAERLKTSDDAAMTLVLKIMERRAKLLGLDSPTKIETADKTFETPDAIKARVMAKLAKLTTPAAPPAPPQGQLSLPAPPTTQQPADDRGQSAPPAPSADNQSDAVLAVLDAIRAGHVEPPIRQAEPDDREPLILDAEIIGPPSFAGVPIGPRPADTRFPYQPPWRRHA